MTRLAILAIGFALGAASVLWLIGRSMSTAEEQKPNADGSRKVTWPPAVLAAWHDEDALPPFDPHLWRERMR